METSTFPFILKVLFNYIRLLITINLIFLIWKKILNCFIIYLHIMTIRNDKDYLKTLWLEVIKTLEKRDLIDLETLQQLNNCIIANINNNVVFVNCPSYIAKVVIDEHEFSIASCFEELLNSEGKSYHIETNFVDFEAFKEKENDEIDLDFFQISLNPNFTFNTFIVGQSNNLAQVGSLACAKSPGTMYNPLFIYGNPGLGKTHLLNAIGNFIVEYNPTLKIVFFTAHTFTEAVHKCSKNQTLAKFKDLLRNIDVLLIDDIQFLTTEKEKTNEIFFDIFNELVSNNKQIVLTADRTPSELRKFDERIISRFNGGLKLNVVAPDFKTRVQILKSKLNNQATELKNSISDDAIEYIAMNFSSDVRELTGALNELLFYLIYFLGPKKRNIITVDDCVECFKGKLKSQQNEISIPMIKKCVCEYYGLTKQQINGKSRTASITTARQIAMYLSRKLLDLPFQKIGSDFGGRDHSTVMNACSKVEEKIKCNSIYSGVVNDIEMMLKPKNVEN